MGNGFRLPGNPNISSLTTANDAAAPITPWVLDGINTILDWSVVKGSTQRYDALMVFLIEKIPLSDVRKISYQLQYTKSPLRELMYRKFSEATIVGKIVPLLYKRETKYGIIEFSDADEKPLRSNIPQKHHAIFKANDIATYNKLPFAARERAILPEKTILEYLRISPFEAYDLLEAIRIKPNVGGVSGKNQDAAVNYYIGCLDFWNRAFHDPNIGKPIYDKIVELLNPEIDEEIARAQKADTSIKITSWYLTYADEPKMGIEYIAFRLSFHATKKKLSRYRNRGEYTDVYNTVESDGSMGVVRLSLSTFKFDADFADHDTITSEGLGPIDYLIAFGLAKLATKLATSLVVAITGTLRNIVPKLVIAVMVGIRDAEIIMPIAAGSSAAPAMVSISESAMALGSDVMGVAATDVPAFAAETSSLAESVNAAPALDEAAAVPQIAYNSATSTFIGPAFNAITAGMVVPDASQTVAVSPDNLSIDVNTRGTSADSKATERRMVKVSRIVSIVTRWYDLGDTEQFNRYIAAARLFYPRHRGAVGQFINLGEAALPYKSGKESGPYLGAQKGSIPRGKGYAFSSGGASQGNIGTHVEGHGAATMWQRGLSYAQVIVDRAICKTCAQNIKFALPANAQMDVFSLEDGKWVKTTFKSVHKK